MLSGCPSCRLNSAGKIIYTIGGSPMTFHHGDTVRRADTVTFPLNRIGIVTLHTENDDTYEVLWDETFVHTWETPESLKLVKRLPIV